ncbi:LacI family transcriptional regulator [Mesorhizobium amorphae]|uniref:LacI family DNA-binding transcriptional regulator n=1 Tax=Mesorhizobium amorphae TaxID=71433 RepID=UPI00235D54AA|nr:LacI family DNA-binding transcriptional regulator [Mesorhizobium amorphae]GLR46110.1 LacI family transcriptional regulator [Mesorhizobium amorphae]
MQRVTIMDLAKAAGLSRATVNRALGDKSTVKRETIEHILEVAEQIGFYGTKAIRNRMKQRTTHMKLGILLQQRSMPFHAELGMKFADFAENWSEEQLTVKVEHMEELSPSLVAKRLRALGEECDAVAVATADHPQVDAAIQYLSDLGKPVFTVISDLGSTAKAGYVGIDNRRLGRAAGWYVCSLIKPGNEVAMLVGTHRHFCQEQREMGFRSYLREHDPSVNVSENLTFESDQGAYEATLDIVANSKNLGAIFVVGGGIRGALKALSDVKAEARPVIVSVELTEETREALLSGALTVVLAHPVDEIAAALTRTMVQALRGERNSFPANTVLPFLTAISEQSDPRAP